MRKKSEKTTEVNQVKSTRGGKSLSETLSDMLPARQRLKCKNENQKKYANLILSKDIVLSSGPAGVGKSYVAVALALELLTDSSLNFKQIILSTPAVEAEENHGFIPGTIREKMDPFIASTIDIVDKLIGKKNRMKLEENEVLIIQPLAYIRGKSIDNTILVMEEAQNMSPRQMKTLLTRIGTNSKFIISGDIDQSDRFRDYKKSGLYDALEKHKNIPELGVFTDFDEKDIVRHKIISKILANYKRDEVQFKPKEKPSQMPIKIEIIQKDGFFSRLFKKIF